MADDSGRLNQVFAETSFLYGANAVFIEMMQERWAEDPNSVPPEWRAFFDQLLDRPDNVKANAAAGSWANPGQGPRDELISAMDGFWPAVAAKVEKGIQQRNPQASTADTQSAARDSIRALMLIRAFRIRGHLQSNLDPLGIEPPIQNPELTPEYWGFNAADQDRPIFIDGVLGLETAQINRDFIYPGNLIANQIQTLTSVGYFATSPGSPSGLAQMPNPITGTADVGTRARAYLHSNCANCHQPNGPGRGGMDFRFTTHWLTGGYCNQTPSFGNLGITNARLLKPDVAAESIIPLRMARADANRMPPLGVHVTDTQGLAVVDAWINSLSGCE